MNGDVCIYWKIVYTLTHFIGGSASAPNSWWRLGRAMPGSDLVDFAVVLGEVGVLEGLLGADALSGVLLKTAFD